MAEAGFRSRRDGGAGPGLEDVSDETRRPGRGRLTLHTADIAGRKLAWREAGHGAPVFFMHGIGGASENWNAQLPSLSDRFRVIAWDMPGYGGSEGLDNPAPAAGAYAESALALLDHLHIDACHLVGQSVAALVAGNMAAAEPERVSRLVLSHPLTGLGGLEEEERQRLRAARLGLFEALGPTRFAYEKGPAILAPGVDDAVRAQAVETMARVRPAGFRQAVEMMSASDLFACIPGIEAPVLVITGAHDPVVPESACLTVGKSLQSARVEVIPGAGHYSAMEKPDIYNEILARFLGGPLP